MSKLKTVFTIEAELENLRDKINGDIIKNIECQSEDAYENLLVTSRELDNVIVDYMKSVNK